MTRRRDANFDLRAAVRDRGFTPRGNDRDALLALIAADDDDADHAARVLVQLGVEAGYAALAAAQTHEGPARAQLVRAAGRLAADAAGEPLRAPLAAFLDDADSRVRRAAARALGTSGDARFADALLARTRRDDVDVAERKVLLSALGKLGAADALDTVTEVAHTAADPLLRRVAEEASLRLARDVVRATAESRIDGDARLPRDVIVRLACRAGFDDLLIEEAASLLAPKRAGAGAARGTLRAGRTLRALRALRTVARVELLGAEIALRDDDLAGAAATALASAPCLALLEAVTVGPLRFRLAWPGDAHRRADTLRVAVEVARRCPALVNDPRDAPWEARLEPDARTRTLRVWLMPRALPDTRFDYLETRAEGASHPTVAAALARLGGVRDDDVVWDPFCGAGTELVERARLGPYARLFGTDLDADVAALAQTTIARAGLAHARVLFGDALLVTPRPAPTLVLTNPPLGRRVGRQADPGALLSHLAARLPAVLAPGARVVWLSPQPDRTARALVAAGFRVTDGTRVDLGGLVAERQIAFLD
jgi:predicted RNA methylase